MPGPSGLSPVTKHIKGKGFRSGEKRQIINVYKTLLEDNPLMAITDIVSKVSSTLGVAKSSVYKIVKEHRSTGQVKSPRKQKSKTKTILNTIVDFTRSAITTTPLQKVNKHGKTRMRYVLD